MPVKRLGKMENWYIYIIMAIIIIVGIVIFVVQKKGIDNLIVGTINNIQIKIEIAADNIQREKGLMFRKYMPDKQGMLFVFPDSQVVTFWMQNTYIPLDMLFIDTNKTIVNIVTGAKSLQTDEVYNSIYPIKYVLEVNSGFVQKYNILTGNSIEFEIPQKVIIQ